MPLVRKIFTARRVLLIALVFSLVLFFSSHDKGVRKVWLEKGEVKEDPKGHYGNVFRVPKAHPGTEFGQDDRLIDFNVHFIVSALSVTNTSWLDHFFPKIQSSVYVTDDASAALTVEKNKGREAAVYLSYIIDHYDNLPEYMIFIHGDRYQWHNEDPMYDGVPVLQRLRHSYVENNGFATLRCTWQLGCPVELDFTGQESADDGDTSQAEDDATQHLRDHTQIAYALGFQHILPNNPLPDKVGVHCGAQFAVTRECVRQRSADDYKRIRQWLWTVDLSDEISGRVLEYMWHIIMQQPPIVCPEARSCFCDKFGICNLRCLPGACTKRYWFRYGTLPAGWPESGTGVDGWPPIGWAKGS